MTHSTAVDTRSLKLHVDHGLVWYLDRDGHPRSSGRAVEDFLDDPLCAQSDCVRLIGNAENASLIIHLYDRKLRGQLASVQVVTPQVCPTASERRSPEACLYHMRRFQRAPVQGGFHEVTALDYPAYALVAELRRTDARTPPSDRALQYLQAHPVWRPLCFVRHVDPANTARLLAEIVDPRWYFDLRNPDRTAKLELYLGLVPKTQHGVVVPDSPKWGHHRRCDLVLHCWYSGAQAQRASAVMRCRGTEPPYDSDEITRAPGDFVWRTWGERLGYGPTQRSPDAVMAALRASQKFIAFLRLVWLARLYEGDTRAAEGGASLFRARDFFRYHVEAEAFNRYMRGGK